MSTSMERWDSLLRSRPPGAVVPSVPVTDADYAYPDHWGFSWWSASDDWGLTMACPVEVGWLFYGLTRATKPQVIVETGTHRGLSALFFGAALRDNGSGHLVTIDVTDHGQAARIATRGLGAWVTTEICASTDYTPSEPIDLLLLDAAHGYAAVEAELRHFLPHVRPGALVLVDDCRLNPDQQVAIRDICRQCPDIVGGFQILTSRGVYVLKCGAGIEVHNEADIEMLRVLPNFLGPG